MASTQRPLIGLRSIALVLSLAFSMNSGCSSLSGTAAEPEHIAGKVVAVHDGDSMTLLTVERQDVHRHDVQESESGEVCAAEEGVRKPQ
jgi:hypothetical protein